MKLAAFLCGLIGIIQFVFSRSLFGLVWVAAAVVLLLVDHFYGE